MAGIAIKGAKNLVMYHKTLRGLVMWTGVLSSQVFRPLEPGEKDS